MGRHQLVNPRNRNCPCRGLSISDLALERFFLSNEITERGRHGCCVFV